MRAMTTISPLAGAILNQSRMLVAADVSRAEALEQTMAALRSQIARGLHHLVADPALVSGSAARSVIRDALELVEYPPPPYALSA